MNCRMLPLGCLLIVTAIASAEEPAKNQSKATPGPFKVEATLEGIFESRTMSEIILRPDEWSELIVKEVVPHGTRVRKGDVILQLDPRKINEAIRDLETSMHSAELTLQQNEVEIKATEPLLPLDMDAAARIRRDAVADLDRFQKLEKELAVRQAEESLKRTRQFVEMEEAELRELTKMYKADDLTEETEEIILKRQRDSVDSARFQLEVAKIEHEKSLQIELPRKEETLKDAATRQSVLYEKSRLSLPMALMKLKLENEKLKIDRARSMEKLGKLKRDQESMTVRSPRDGIVYYGACVLGTWQNSTELAVKLRRGGTLAANDVALTVVDVNDLAIRVAVPEKQLGVVRRGSTGYATWADLDDCRCDVRVESLSAVPVGPGKFTAMVEAVNFNSRCPVPPLPGMACSVVVQDYARESAIAVPNTAIQTDEWDNRKKFVFIVGADGKNEKRPVSVGKKNDKKTEILEGLKAGETFLTTKPEE